MNPLGLLFAAVLAVGAAFVPQASAAAGQMPPLDAPPYVAADEPTAREQAVHTGRQVEITSATTETTRVFAQPNGTLRAEISAVPQRVRRADSSWANVDTRLRLVNGRLRPIAALSPVDLSAGGDGPLARLSALGGRVAYTWKGPLPVPEIVGDTAVYRDVYAGVDLRVRALPDGFTYALVVKTRAAAAHPGLRTLTLGVTGERLTITGKPQGGIVAKTVAGKAAVETGGALMWDQRGASLVDMPKSEREMRMMGVEGTLQELALRAKDVLAEPADLARKVKLPAKFHNGQLTVETDLALLNDPQAVFPLVIDPVSKTIPGFQCIRPGPVRREAGRRSDPQPVLFGHHADRAGQPLDFGQARVSVLRSPMVACRASACRARLWTSHRCGWCCVG